MSARPADFGTRFSAWTIDAIGLFSVQWIVVIVMSRQLQAAGMVERAPCEVDAAFTCEGPSAALWALIAAFVVVSTFGYHTWFDGVAGASPGKRLMGLRVVDRNGDDATPIGWARGVVRALVRQGVWIWTFLFLAASPIALDVPSPVFFGTLVLSLATFAWGAYAPNGIALHDHVAATSVVHAASLPSHAAPVPRGPSMIEPTP